MPYYSFWYFHGKFGDGDRFVFFLKKNNSKSCIRLLSRAVVQPYPSFIIPKKVADFESLMISADSFNFFNWDKIGEINWYINEATYTHLFVNYTKIYCEAYFEISGIRAF